MSEQTQSVPANQTAPYLPVVMLTCCSQPKERDQGFAAGADDYLIKPVDIDRLLDSVDFRTGTSQEIKRHCPLATS